MTLQTALDELHQQGRATPCYGRADQWDSDDPDVRQQAARLCRGCPIRAVCAGEKVPHATGVWGGRDRTEHKTGRPSGTGRQFTDEEQSTIRAAAFRGATTPQIAALVDAPIGTVGRWLRNNVPPAERRPANGSKPAHPWAPRAVYLRDRQHLSFQEIADVIGVPIHRVRHAYYRKEAAT